MPAARPRFVHLVGSAPLSSTQDVLDAASNGLSQSLRTVPDGEIGERKSFVQWQRVHIPAVVRKPIFDGTPDANRRPVELKSSDIKPLRYDDAAIASYKMFKTMRAQGQFRPDCRFQVCLPTPASVVRSLVDSTYCEQVEPLYEARLLECLKRIQDEVPHEDLAIQWDMPIEMAMMELDRGNLTEKFFVDFFQPYFSPVREGIIERFKRLAAAVEPKVKMGFHMCYGNFRQKHWLEPGSVDLVVQMTNLLSESLSNNHSVDFVHVPVPKDRLDSAYLEPLKHLETKSTQIILGLVHGHDLAGTRARIETAKAICPADFGISTECGMTGKTVEYFESVMQICAAVVEP